MEVPLRFALWAQAGSIRRIGPMLFSALLVACAARPGAYAPVLLDRPKVSFPSGRVTLSLVDEYGLPMTRTRVDFAWERPQFYKTMGFTDSLGRVTFSGVPQVAMVSIDHAGGNWSRTLIVPQQGRADLRVTLDTNGWNQAERIRQRLVPAATSTQ